MRHINLAQTHPELTDPKVSGKLIPGSIASGKTLSRLYDKWDTAAGEQKKRNTAAMDRVCATIKPSNTDGLDCDEYPFASTWEGAG